MADISHWFVRRRGVAITLCSAGNYLAGTVRPPLVQRSIAAYGWRTTHVSIGIACAVAMIAIGFLALRQRAPAPVAMTMKTGMRSPGSLGLSPNMLQALLAIASVCLNSTPSFFNNQEDQLL